ncbi:hypothetical protein DS831_06025 [Bombilactobacillus bombi]|uniref:Uncharacterized protein n=2 Tax=Bombilactobacillus bombi TaxID=1303590 RepID=A0A417ZG68_9LACO|nr:hypothetical protein DS831_06025 [Bombilactobacillus bombi]
MGDILPILWFDKVTIIGTKPHKHGSFTNNEDAVIVQDEPAKVILKDIKPSEQSFFGTDEYDAKLLIRNDIKIPAGAKIVVTDVNGNKVQYIRSSKGYGGYVSHQEVAMIRDEKASDNVQ